MKLLTKLFLITDSNGKDINVEGKPVVLALNGEKTNTKLEDVFSGLEYDLGEIYGNSLLSLYQVQEDGSLQVEGSKIQLINADTDELILVKKIDKPWINNHGNISFEDVQKFAEYFKIARPEEVFPDLNAEEKQAFISGRQATQEAKTNADTLAKANEEAEAASKKEADRIAREKEEAEFKASLDPVKEVLDKNGYESIRTYYAGLEGFKQYVKGPYELFYGDDPEYSIAVLIKRGDAWWQEIKEEDAEIIERNDKEVIIEFPDKEVRKYITLNREAQEIEITEAKAKE